MSADRVEAELNLLRGWFGSALEYRPDGHWIRLPDYHIPSGLWVPRIVEVCFQIPAGIPGQEPYAFHVRPGVALSNHVAINAYAYPTTTGFGENWGTFSWAPNSWQPGVTPQDGSSMLDFARSFADRFRAGP